MATKKEEVLDVSNTCVVCFKGVDIYSIGQCDHPVCFECSTRMRVLCRQNECPICRQEMPKVIFTKNVRPFSTIEDENYLVDYKFKINFETAEEASAFDMLLAHECPVCKKFFNSFHQMRDHVRRAHLLYYCDLCVDNLKILSRERKCYTRQELGTHRRVGDIDNRSHRGHPLCQFCDTRYMDNDELYRHLRRDHLYCHFCDADGLHQYYNTYDFLREHFRNEHFLCEEGDCYNEKFTAVFRTDIDLKAHKTTTHGKGLGKAGLKQARTLDIEFVLAPRPRPAPRRQHREDETDVGAVGGVVIDEPTVPERNTVAFAQLNTECIEEFPTLGKTTTTPPCAPPVTPSNRNAASNVMKKGVTNLYEKNFPALGPDSAQVSLKVNSERTVQKPNPPPNPPPRTSTNVSIQVNHPRFTTTVTSHNSYNYHFPALEIGASVAPSASATVQWTSKKVGGNKSPVHLQHGNTATAVASGHDPPPEIESFPALTPIDNCKEPKQDENQTQTLSSVVSSSSCDPPLVSSSKVKKKKKSKNHVSSSVDLPPKEPSGNSTKKLNTLEVTCGADSSSVPSSGLKKKPKENVAQFSNETTETNSNTNKTNNNNRKMLKTPKIESTKANHVNDTDKKKMVSSKSSPEKTKNSKSEQINEKTKVKIKQTSKKNNVTELEAYPALGNAGAPPGFEPKWQVKRPPPGLDKPSLLMPSSVASNAPPPGFTLMNGFPPLGADLVSTEAQYITPPNFVKRNNTLVTKMTSALGSESLEMFKQVSFSFRTGNVPPQEYYNTCREIMGLNTFSELFPELLVLLPDIKKQQELWLIYKDETSKNIEQVSKTSKKKKNKEVTNVSSLEVCATCYQVVTSSDLRDHLTYHALDNHFPVLDAPTYNNNAWVHRK